ncbi:GHMP family kinase ATP-binding protein [Streptomyces sp. NBC_00370]|uniref:GHMP family kinase ATP-binding protein n=1 Tax=Streptomyces sp. NBC_00370 TaxID=2975728 RepID=UPI002E27128B
MPSTLFPEAAVLPGRRRAVGVSTCYGTFGELLQGALPSNSGDGDFLVTLPIARWSAARFTWDAPAAGVRVRPAHKHKAQRMAAAVLETFGAAPGGELVIEGDLPEGKGFASSSADLVATARAVANALSVTLPEPVLERLLSEIEPTDGVLYPGIVAFDHRAVRLRSRLGSLPEAVIIGVDEGGEIDTVAFNRHLPAFTRRQKLVYAGLLERMAEAVARRDLSAVGALATRSALLNQDRCPKRLLEPVLRIALEVGALGVTAAHSGTMLGIVLDPADPGYLGRFAAALDACSELEREVTLHRTLSFDLR